MFLVCGCVYILCGVSINKVIELMIIQTVCWGGGAVIIIAYAMYVIVVVGVCMCIYFMWCEYQ